MSTSPPYESPAARAFASSEAIVASNDLEAIAQHPSLSILYLTCKSDSMLSAFVPPGARVRVDPLRPPLNGDIVVAMCEGKFIIRFLKISEYKTVLVPANSKYSEISITAGMRVQLWVVTEIITDSEHLRKYML